MLLFVAPAAGARTFDVVWANRELSVTAEAAPLTEVLIEVAQRTGIKIAGVETLREQVTLKFSRLTLREGLRSVCCPAVANYAIVEELGNDGKYEPILVYLAGSHVQVTELGRTARAPQPTDTETLAASEEVPGARLDRFLAQPDPGVRRAAVERLADIGDQWGFSRLMAALHDKDSTVREAAVKALGSYGPQSIESVTDLLKSETHSEVRIAAMQMLAQFSRPGEPRTCFMAC